MVVALERKFEAFKSKVELKDDEMLDMLGLADNYNRVNIKFIHYRKGNLKKLPKNSSIL